MKKNMMEKKNHRPKYHLCWRLSVDDTSLASIINDRNGNSVEGDSESKNSVISTCQAVTNNHN
ncbi:hypothetical protein TYRP_018371 [Tyrophagus putrescentiae]|nr:hypothetical protein TYRP_018371 [Tyrophagus putrescentiae]